MISKHKLVAVVAVLVVAVVGTGAAVGASGALSPKQESEAVVNDAAEELGVEPSELTAALKTALKNRVDAAVEAGRLTEAQGQAMKERIDAGDVPLFGLGGGPRFHHEHHGVAGGLDAAADYLGLTEAQLRTSLGDGKTLAQVAKAEGKSVDGLVNALVADAKARLADAVKEGRLTQAQSKAMQSGLKARIAQMVQSTPPARGMRGPGPGFAPAPEAQPEGSTATA
jgi:hypothetical protein